MTREPRWVGHLDCAPPTGRSHETNHRLDPAPTASAHTVVVLFYVNVLPKLKNKEILL